MDMSQQIIKDNFLTFTILIFCLLCILRTWTRTCSHIVIPCSRWCVINNEFITIYSKCPVVKRHQSFLDRDTKQSIYRVKLNIQPAGRSESSLWFQRNQTQRGRGGGARDVYRSSSSHVCYQHLIEGAPPAEACMSASHWTWGPFD